MLRAALKCVRLKQHEFASTVRLKEFFLQLRYKVFGYLFDLLYLIKQLKQSNRNDVCISYVKDLGC